MPQKLFDLKEIVDEYIDVLEALNIHVERVILYGSQALGTARPDSDIDIVVISKDLANIDFPERLEVLSKATLHIAAPLEVIGYTPEEIAGREGKSIFWDEICTTGRELYKAA